MTSLASNTTHRRSWLGKTTLALTPLACAISLHAQAGEFEWGEVSGRYNGSVSAGTILSAEKPNNDFIFQGNANSIGYDRREISQLSLGFIKSIPQVLGANNLSLVGEMAAKYVHDLPGLDERRYVKGDLYGTDFADGSAAGCAAGSPKRYHKHTCSSDGNATKFSWGYRMRAQLNYPGLLAGVDVSPYVAFGHDVQGWSHDGNFVEDRLMGSLGVKADYLQKYSAEMSWSGSGNTPFAPTDRDFVALSLRMGF